jgi:hypothetical protein
LKSSGKTLFNIFVGVGLIYFIQDPALAKAIKVRKTVAADPQVNFQIKREYIQVEGAENQIPIDQEGSPTVFSGEHIESNSGDNPVGIVDVKKQEDVVIEPLIVPDRPKLAERYYDVARDVSSAVHDSEIIRRNNERFRKSLLEKLNADFKNASQKYSSGAQ